MCLVLVVGQLGGHSARRQAAHVRRCSNRCESGPRVLFECMAVSIRRLHALLREGQLMILCVLTWNFLPISLLFC